MEMSDCMQVSGCVSGTLLSCLCVFVKINLPWCLHHGPLKKKKKKNLPHSYFGFKCTVPNFHTPFTSN